MDRLLPMFLRRLVRRRSFTVTTAAGQTYTFGDGTGKPVAVRFTSAAQRGILLDPELKFGEAYMDGTFVVEEGSIADVLAIVLGQALHPDLGAAAAVALSLPPPAAVQSASRARHNVAHHYDLDGRLYCCSSTPTANTAAPISNSRRPVARRRPARQEAPSRRQTVLAARRQRARHRLRLGRPRALSRGNCRRARSPASRCRRSSYASPRSARSSAGYRRATFQLRGLPRRRRPLRPHRIGRHVRACRRQFLRRILPQDARSSWPTTASWCCMRSAAAARSITNPWIAKYIFPGRLYPGAVGGVAGDRTRRPAGHRHRNPATALCRDAQGLARTLPRPPRRGRAALR